MGEFDYHFISVKFLTAILMAVFFAFLLIYVFSPVQREDYPVYSFEKENITDFKEQSIFSSAEKNQFLLSTAQKEKFESESKNRSFAIMEQSKKAVLAVITSNHLEKINGLKEEEELLLNDFKRDLEQKEEELLQQKRQELENELSTKLQNFRQRVKAKYSDYSQQEIRENYLKMINLRIAVEVLAQNADEKRRYQRELEQVREEQDQLLAEKNNILSEEISTETSSLIMDFNKQFAKYRSQLRNRHQKLIDQRKDEIDFRMARHREDIKLELNSTRNEKVSEMDQLIAQSKEYY